MLLGGDTLALPTLRGERCSVYTTQFASQFTRVTGAKVRILRTNVHILDTAVAVEEARTRAKAELELLLTYAGVCWRMLTYADVC